MLKLADDQRWKIESFLPLGIQVERIHPVEEGCAWIAVRTNTVRAETRNRSNKIQKTMFVGCAFQRIRPNLKAAVMKNGLVYRWLW